MKKIICTILLIGISFAAGFIVKNNVETEQQNEEVKISDVVKYAIENGEYGENVEDIETIDVSYDESDDFICYATYDEEGNILHIGAFDYTYTLNNYMNQE